MSVFAEIATLTGLRFDSEVRLEHSDSLNRETIRVLFDAGLCPDRATLAKICPTEKQFELPYGDEEQRENSRSFPSDTSILDKLGEYRPGKKEILIYDVMCQLAAAALEVDVEILKQIVEAHETAHAVTHLGKDSEGRIWENFAIAESEDKELFAQLYVLLLLKEGDARDATALHDSFSLVG